jgi:ankyrin repeat protein
MLTNPTLDIQVGDVVTGVNSFWIAAYYGHGAAMGVLAEKGIDIFSINQKTGANALHIAVSKNYVNVVRMLIESEYPLDTPKFNGKTALGIASCKKDRLKIVKMLIKAGANVNHTTKNGLSPLYFALQHDNYLCVKKLVKKGAKMYYKDKVMR